MSGKGKPGNAHLGAKLVAIHVVHTSLIGVHILVVITAFSKWSIPVGALDISLVQTGITAGLQVTFIIIFGGLLALVREIAIDADIRDPPTLGLLPSTGSTVALIPRTQISVPSCRTGKCIMLTCSTCHTQRAQNAAVNMFTARTNNTRYPGLHGSRSRSRRGPLPQNYRDIQRKMQKKLCVVQIDNIIDQVIPWTQACVNATLVNVHCSQISDATINTFILPAESTDSKLAVPSPRDSRERFLFRNASSFFNYAAWIDVSMPAPPYWDPSMPGLNITGRWGNQGNSNLPTLQKRS
ncbi:hypothetical protein C8R43DRAFT_941362 [Mycena crocata]|nr:hypothetical protein C8R43DRAFT_941362 [Mycena crocata]